jgi:hypothetical protein
MLIVNNLSISNKTNYLFYDVFKNLVGRQLFVKIEPTIFLFYSDT